MLSAFLQRKNMIERFFLGVHCTMAIRTLLGLLKERDYFFNSQCAIILNEVIPGFCSIPPGFLTIHNAILFRMLPPQRCHAFPRAITISPVHAGAADTSAPNIPRAEFPGTKLPITFRNPTRFADSHRAVLIASSNAAPNWRLSSRSTTLCPTSKKCRRFRYDGCFTNSSTGRIALPNANVVRW